MIDTNILGTVIVIAFILFIILFALTIKSTADNRRQKRASICASGIQYPVACAGSPIQDIPAKAYSLPLEYIEFKDKDGNVIDPDGFLHFIVKGESMQFADIHDNYMVFSNKNTHPVFPAVIVIRREAAPKDQVQFKIRRGWLSCNVNNAMDMARKIVASKDFDIIRNLLQYDGDEALLADFENNRLRRYLEQHPFSSEENDRYFNVIISTTYHTDNSANVEERGKIMLSIHPASLLVGEVVKSFPM